MQKDIADNFKQRQVLSFSYTCTLQFISFYTPKIHGLCQGLHPCNIEWRVLAPFQVFFQLHAPLDLVLSMFFNKET